MNGAKVGMVGSMLWWGGCAGGSPEGAPWSVECGYAPAASVVVDVSTVPGAAQALDSIAAAAPAHAVWWDGSETELFVSIDPDNLPVSATQTTYEFDAALSGAQAFADLCPPVHYWTMSVPLSAAGTTDGAVQATEPAVEVVCSDNGNRYRMEEYHPDGQCDYRIIFEVGVDVAEERVPTELVADAYHAWFTVYTDGSGTVTGGVVPGAADGGLPDEYTSTGPTALPGPNVLVATPL